MIKKIVVIYHGDCADGFGGAWAAWKKFGNKARYLAAKHHAPPLSGFKNKEIYFIDFIYPEKVTRQLIRNNERVTAIDHHISARKIVKLTKDYSYALNHSGSVLAWQYFHPKVMTPKFLKHIEDIDLWKLKLPNTREAIAFLNLFKFDFKIWSKIARDLEKASTRKFLIAQGKIVLRREKQIVKQLAASAESIEFAGYRTLAVNSPVFRSEIGAVLVKKKPPISIVWRQKSGQRLISLRSNGRVDVSKIAERFGGGGHKAAAGFSIDSKKPLPWKELKK